MGISDTANTQTLSLAYGMEHKAIMLAHSLSLIVNNKAGVWLEILF
jgi:hypothetical protein